MGLLKLNDDMPTDLANSMKADEEDRRSDHAPLVAVTENEEVATLTATIKTNLRQGDIATEASSQDGGPLSEEQDGMWRLSPESVRDDLKNIYMLLFRFLGNGFRLAQSKVSWLATREFVVFVPDPIGFAPWLVLFGRGEPCDSCQDTTHVVVLCFSCPMTCHKSTRRGDLGDEVDGMTRKRRRRLQRVPGAF